ncbi:MAG: LamG domain-containing protein, partial [Candidatus Moranbacteria bacterium]|nr:LamG domain-containing protein [Candidatus Moranbacteria bacterium]
IYDFNGNAGNEYGIYITGGTNYVYNNTIYNCEYGMSQQYSGTILVAKNNIIKGSGNTNAYAGTFTNSDYNATDGTDVGDGGAHSKISQTFSFVDETNDDFHLLPSDTSARNSGVDLSQDYWLPITSDIDGHARPASARGYGVATDIGADEGATAIYRSIAPSMSTYLDRGVDESGTDLSVSGTTLTLENAAPDNVGVGDAIQYDSDGNSSIDAIAFISARASSTSFTVQARDGANPVAVTNDQDWQIFRAYTTLDNAEGGAENTANIDDDVDDFDISVSRNDGKDIYTSNEQWNIAAYANGTTADTVAVDINGWTTAPQNYIKIYTPVNSNEVGVSQRHEGKWDDSKYRLVINDGTGILEEEDFFRIDGLQVETTNPSASGRQCINFTNLTTGGKIYVSNNIVRGHSSVAYNQKGINYYGTTNIIDFYIYNNIVYNFINNSSSDGFYLGGLVSNWYVYNNTVYNCYTGFFALGGADPYYFNNIAQGCIDGFGAIKDASSNYNISNTSQSDADSVNATFNGYKTVSFVDSANYDFHLDSSDTSARSAGVNLWDDSVLSVREDIDGDPRSEVGSWDIGADEGIFYQSNVSGMGTATMQMSLTDKMTDGLVGMWSFDGPDIDWTTNTAYDRSPAGGNNGTITGATPAIGKKGQALSFNGTTDFVDAGDVGSGIQTISFWVKTDDATSRKIINIDGTDQIEIDGAGNVLATSFPDATVYVDGAVSPAVDTSWHFVTITDAVGVNASTFQIGQVASSFFDGIIDEVRIYNRAFSSDEVLRLYNLGSAEYVR